MILVRSDELSSCLCFVVQGYTSEINCSSVYLIVLYFLFLSYLYEFMVSTEKLNTLRHEDAISGNGKHQVNVCSWASRMFLY